MDYCADEVAQEETKPRSAQVTRWSGSHRCRFPFHRLPFHANEPAEDAVVGLCPALVVTHTHLRKNGHCCRVPDDPAAAQLPMPESRGAFYGLEGERRMSCCLSINWPLLRCAAERRPGNLQLQGNRRATAGR